MSKKTIVFALAIIMALLSGCKKKEPFVALSILSSETFYGSQGGQGVITFESSLPVTVSSEQNWLSWTTSEGAITLDVTPNPTREVRYGVLSFQTEQEKKEINITQDGFSFMTDLESITTDNDGISRSFLVRSDAPVVFSSTADWIEWVWEGDDFALRVLPNEEGKFRSGKLTWEYGDLSGEISVIQFGLESLIGKYRFSRVMEGKCWVDANTSYTFDGETMEGIAEIKEDELIIPTIDDEHMFHMPASLVSEDGVYKIVVPQARVVLELPMWINYGGYEIKLSAVYENGLVLQGTGLALLYTAMISARPVSQGSLSMHDLRFEPIED